MEIILIPPDKRSGKQQEQLKDKYPSKNLF